ncbi:MAG: hypothetical protein HY775_03145 [Acidobacteria bacterium]|nr:hypothetical protein [Acidobacteriota bacterium]
MYTVQQYNSSWYKVYFDFNFVANAEEAPWTREIDVGIETTDSTATFPTTTDDRLQRRDATCCTWRYWSSGSEYESDPACYVWTWITYPTKGKNGRYGNPPC